MRELPKRQVEVKRGCRTNGPRCNTALSLVNRGNRYNGSPASRTEGQTSAPWGPNDSDSVEKDYRD